MSDDLVITWKEITNFIPFNFEWINILPNEERDFIWEWRWFATNKLDQAQKITIEYQSPSEYFSNQDKKIKIGYPFYTTISREKMKNLTAKISVNDNWSIPNWKDYIQEVPFTIKYQWIEVVPNFAIFFWLKHILNFL